MVLPIWFQAADSGLKTQAQFVHGAQQPVALSAWWLCCFYLLQIGQILLHLGWRVAQQFPFGAFKLRAPSLVMLGLIRMGQPS